MERVLKYGSQQTKYKSSDFDIELMRKRCLAIYEYAKYEERYSWIYAKTRVDPEFNKLTKALKEYFLRFSKIAIKRLPTRAEYYTCRQQKRR